MARTHLHHVFVVFVADGVAVDLHGRGGLETAQDAAVRAHLELCGGVLGRHGVVAVARHEHDVVGMLGQEVLAADAVRDDELAHGFAFGVGDRFAAQHAACGGEHVLVVEDGD